MNAPRTPERGARWWRPAGLLAPAFAAVLFGCAMNKPEPTEPCTRAVDKLEDECGFVVEGVDGGTELNCTGAAACAADCLYAASCEDIEKNAPAFTDCLDGCQP